MTSIPEYFGDMVFDDAAMKTRLPKDAYEAMKRTIEDGRSLNLGIANAVASAMKDWAISKGATHFTHWFQPMTGITAEKHDCFYHPHGKREGHHGIFRQGAYQGRARCLLLPLRRSARYI